MTICELPLDEHFEKYDAALLIRETEGVGSIRIARRLGISERAVRGWINEGKCPTRRVRRLSFEPSSELSYVIGVYLGDGSLSHCRAGNYAVHLGVVDYDFAETFASALAVLLKREPVPVYPKKAKPPSQNQHQVIVMCRHLYEFLSGKRLEKFKPIIEKFPAEFIQGFFDSEGNIGVDGKRRYLRMSNKNKRLLQFIKNLLEKAFRIKAHIHIENRKKGSFVLYIGQKSHVVKFMERIGTNLKRQQIKYERRRNK